MKKVIELKVSLNHQSGADGLTKFQYFFFYLLRGYKMRHFEWDLEYSVFIRFN